MHAWILLAATTWAPESLPDGTVVYLQNSNSFVEAYTKEAVTHVAIILNRAGESWLYEAIPGKVRSLPLSKYIDEMRRWNQGRTVKARMFAAVPAEEIQQEDIAILRAFLEAEVGRRYSVRNYVRQKPGDGVHCAELLTTSLGRIGRCQIDAPYAASPGKVIKLLCSDVNPPVEFDIAGTPPEESWWAYIGRQWEENTTWCHWACWETWTFCW